MEGIEAIVSRGNKTTQVRITKDMIECAINKKEIISLEFESALKEVGY